MKYNLLHWILQRCAKRKVFSSDNSDNKHCCLLCISHRQQGKITLTYISLWKKSDRFILMISKIRSLFIMWQLLNMDYINFTLTVVLVQKHRQQEDIHLLSHVCFASKHAGIQQVISFRQWSVSTLPIVTRRGDNSAGKIRSPIKMFSTSWLLSEKNKGLQKATLTTATDDT